MSIGTDSDTPIYGPSDHASIERSILGRRLSSPDHYRLYFALSQPSGAPKVEDFDRLLEAASVSADSVGSLLRIWFSDSDPIMGSKAEIILERLRRPGAFTLTATQATHILEAFSNTLDDANALKGTDGFGSPGSWRAAERTLVGLLTTLSVRRRRSALVSIFTEGAAIGWLTSILRHETFSHGRYGNQREDASKWILTDHELELISRVMTKRYERMTLQEISTVPRQLSLLFAWIQAGDPQGPRTLLTKAARNDSGFLDVLELLSSEVTSTEGTYRVIRRENVDPFIPFDDVLARLKALANARSLKVSQRAKSLLRQLEDARGF